MPNSVADTCPHYPRGVPNGHCCGAEIVLVGEAPGEAEADQGLPFVGPAGWLLDNVLAEARLSRHDVYVTNVLSHRPAAFSNDIKLVDRRTLAAAAVQLVERLRSRFADVHPRVVVPVGGTALYALTGKGGIQKWRGSIIEAPALWDGQKAIPSLHPAGVMRTPSLVKTLIADWKRIAGDRKFPELRLPQCNWVIYPSEAEGREFEEQVRAAPNTPLFLDIETGRDHRILCVGFSLDETTAVTFMWPADRARIKRLCESPNPKGGTNLMYDIWHLWSYGVGVTNYLWDVACMFHCLDPNAGPTTKAKGKGGSDGGEQSRIRCYSLGYMASLFTRLPYWKDDPKDDGEGSRVRDSETWWRDFLTYNGKDNTGAYGIYVQLRKLLANCNRLTTYHRLYSSLFDPLVRLMLRGVCIDVRAAEEKFAGLKGEVVAARARAESLAGRPLHSIVTGAEWWECGKCKGKGGTPTRHKSPTCPKGGETRRLAPKVIEGVSLSNDKLKEYLYGPKREGGLGISARTKQGRPTVDEAALRTLHLTQGGLCTDVIGAILEVRRKEKLSSFIAPGVADSDGRIRSQYKQLVSTGRLSSSRNPGGTGANLQNTDAELMYLLKPAPGKIFLRVDLSLAEDRVVKVLTGVPRLIDEARRLPAEFDSHTEFAAKLFTVIIGHSVRPVKGHGDDEVSFERRYLGKRGRHARNYGMTEMKLAEIIAKEGPELGITRVVGVDECKKILDAVDAVTPEVETHFQRPIRDIVRDSGKLVNSWGAEIDFSVEYRFARFLGPRGESFRWEVFRRAYAWMPQSEVGRLMNQWGLIPLQEWIDENEMDTEINLQRHDELVVSVAPDLAYETASFLVAGLERPRAYRLGGNPAVELTIPVELAFARDGGKAGMLEFKQLPKRAVFERKLEQWLSE